MSKPRRFVSLGRQRLNKAFRARDLDAVKEHTRRELELLARLHADPDRTPYDEPRDDDKFAF